MENPSQHQIEMATDFLLSAAGEDAPLLAREELRDAFRNGNFDLARYWRAIHERSSALLAGRRYDTGEAKLDLQGQDNVVHVNFGRNACR